MPSNLTLIEQVLDRGKRSWSKDDDAAGDADVFYTEIVLKLRELHQQGVFESLHEHRASRHGATRIDRVDIAGSINYDFTDQAAEDFKDEDADG